MADESKHNATPGAVKEAEARDVDLAAIGSGRGADGRITQEDVKEFADDLDAQRAAAEATKSYEVSLNPSRTSIEIVTVLDGERRAFSGGETVSGEEKAELSKLKVSAPGGGKVQALYFKEVSA